MTRNGTLFLVFIAGAAGVDPGGAAAQLAKVSRHEYDNGLTAIVVPVGGSPWVAVETVYDVGFLHEPAGMTQASHLLEHLVCYGATSSFAERAAMEQLNSLGLANAETLPHLTHYDYLVPAEKLPLVLQVEHERLSSLRFDAALINAEALRCYDETDVVEANPQSGMVKHAMMAFSQAWRFGRTEVLVRGGLGELPVEQLQQFHRDTYQPERLTVVVIGNVDAKAVLELIGKTLGTVPRGSTGVASVDWAQAPRRLRVKWDAKPSAVCLAYPPPETAAERAVLTVFGSMVAQRLANHPELKRLASMVFISSTVYPVCELPFFVYAAARPEAAGDLDKLEQALRGALAESLVGTRKLTPMVYLALSEMRVRLDLVNPTTVQTMASMLEKNLGQQRDQAQGMALLQFALDAGQTQSWMGGDMATVLTKYYANRGPGLPEVAAVYLSSEREIVTWVGE